MHIPNPMANAKGDNDKKTLYTAFFAVDFDNLPYIAVSSFIEKCLAMIIAEHFLPFNIPDLSCTFFALNCI